MRRLLIVGLLAMSGQSCILSRLTDRAFTGFSVKRPIYADRYYTGLVLLPLTIAVDAATLPIQLIILAIVGDDFVLGHEGYERYEINHYVENLKQQPSFQRLTPEQQATAIAEFEDLLLSGGLDPSYALGLSEDGHWVKVPLSDEARAQLLVRAKVVATPEPLAMCTP
jgi:hypothetical protein